MDNAKQHWKILQELGSDLENRVREFLVIGGCGEGVMMLTEDGQGFWLGEMEFGWGESKTATKPTPLDVSGLVQMAKGYSHILLLNESGHIYAMGKNDRGQLGLGTVDEETYFLPHLISIPHKFTLVRCGNVHSLALTEDGKVWAWGSNEWGQVGVPSSTSSLSSPHQIFELDSHRIVAVECSGRHSLALTDQGEVYAWGWNYWGQHGNGSTTSTHTPTRIPSSIPVQSMAAGLRHTLLLTRTGEVYACGENGHGQLGFLTTTEYSSRLSKVAVLPSISQIASHPLTNLSIAMSHDQRCFVWGEFVRDRTSILTGGVLMLELPPEYSTVESPLSVYSPHRNTPHSVTIPVTPPSRLSVKMSRMFDNPAASPDVQFVVEQRTIHAHRIILSNSSDYFVRMFSERLFLAQVNPEDPILRVTISDHSYLVFHAFLRFLYTDCFELYTNLLPELFELASHYLVPDLQKLCISRMRTTLTPATCCLYYQFTYRHPELATFQQELVQFISTNFFEVIATAAYQSMDPKICKKLTLSMSVNHP